MGSLSNSLAIGLTGLSYPPRDAMLEHAREIEASGVADYLWCGDQMVLTIPRSIMTPDVLEAAGSAGGFDVASSVDPDAWMDAFVALTLQSTVLERTKVGVAVIDAIRRPPPILAQSLMSLDHAAGGGSFFILAGGENKQFAPYGLSRERPIAHLEDAVRHCKLLWNSRGEPVTDNGKVYALDRAVLALPPVNGVPPQAWVAGGTPRTLEIAGRYADGWISWAPGASSPEEYAAKRDIVRSHAEQAGRDPDELRYGCMFVTMLVENDEQHRAALNDPMLRLNSLVAGASAARWATLGLQHPIGGDWAYMANYMPQWWSREETLDVISRIPGEAVDRTAMIGSAEEVSSRIQEYIDAGCDFVMPVPYASPLGNEAFYEMVRDLKVRNATPTPPG